MHNRVKTILVSLSAVLVLVGGTVVGTNLVTAEPGPSPDVTVTFNYSGATGGTSVTTATFTPGTVANADLPHPTKTGVSFSGWFSTQSLLNGQRITTIEESDAGTLIAGFVPSELAQNLNLVLPTASYAVGRIGPGGGTIFYVDMARAAGSQFWEVGSDLGIAVWTTTATKCYAAGLSTGNQNCQTNNLYPGTSEAQAASSVGSEAIGMGSANTAAIKARMDAGSESASAYAAGLASAYTGGGLPDWFLPSRDELNQLCKYAHNQSTTVANQAVVCNNTSPLRGEFVSGFYLSSSQYTNDKAHNQNFANGGRNSAGKNLTYLRVRPIRAF